MDTLQSALDASPEAVIVVDQDGIIEQTNRNVEDILGYTPQELEWMGVEELLSEEDRENHVQFRQEYMEDPEPRPMGRELDLYAVGNDGKSIPVEISLGPIKQDGDLYVVATITDITKRKQRRRKLQGKNQRLNNFANTVSHDLRNPLNVAKGRRALAEEECETEHLDDAGRALGRSLDLIDDMLELARSGEQVSDMESVDVANLVQICWDNVQTADATIVADVDATINADRSRSRQLLENLFRNAVKHSGDDLTVTVGELDAGLYVGDDGPGIPKTDREDVFEGGYSTGEGGTGFGLSIVKEIVEAHGWEIRITDSTDGGARFEITGVGFTAE